MTTQPASQESKPKAAATLSYMDNKGQFTDLQLNLGNEYDRAKLNKTLYWAMCNKIEIRIRPAS